MPNMLLYKISMILFLSKDILGSEKLAWFSVTQCFSCWWW